MVYSETSPIELKERKLEAGEARLSEGTIRVSSSLGCHLMPASRKSRQISACKCFLLKSMGLSRVNSTWEPLSNLHTHTKEGGVDMVLITMTFKTRLSPENKD